MDIINWITEPMASGYSLMQVVENKAPLANSGEGHGMLVCTRHDFELSVGAGSYNKRSQYSMVNDPLNFVFGTIQSLHPS